MSSTAMHHAIKLQLKFIGCIAYRCGYVPFFIHEFNLEICLVITAAKVKL
jgi:hypothetical protein